MNRKVGQRDSIHALENDSSAAGYFGYWSSWDEIFMWGSLFLGCIALMVGFALPFVSEAQNASYDRLLMWIESALLIGNGTTGIWSFGRGWRTKLDCRRI